MGGGRMKQLFNTKLRIILVIAVLVTAGLSVDRKSVGRERVC